MVVAVLLPLWASYVVKVYAWRLIFSNEGVAELGARATGHQADRASGTWRSGSSSRTSGCPT